jgi:hypothetical protein
MRVVVKHIDIRLNQSFLMNRVGLILSVGMLLMMGPLRAQVFTPEAFIQQVKQYHPVAKQAGIQVLKANADVQSARGGFDPAFTYEGSNKTFDGKNYYFYNNPELKIPTALGGLDIKTGLESNGGAFLNSEASGGKTSYLGVEMPLGKGLTLKSEKPICKKPNKFKVISTKNNLRWSITCCLRLTILIGNGRGLINCLVFMTAILPLPLSVCAWLNWLIKQAIAPR